ncbi:MAG: SH3 domain-containing protein [Pseudomonadota bacterium]
MRLVASLGSLLVFLFIFAPAAAAQEGRISSFSGKPVPRFESLRYGLTNGRAGPSLDHPIRWAYQREGLPVRILKESQNWRFVEDPDGARVWMHARMLSAERNVMIREETLLRVDPDETSRAVARLSSGLIVGVVSEAGSWLRVTADGYRGWVQMPATWGVSTGALPTNSDAAG